MSFLQALALTGTAATILGVFLTAYALINNKTLKSEAKLTRETLQQALAEESRLTREKIEETNKYLGDLIKEITKYLGDLIVADGERTRLAIKNSNNLG